MKILTASFGTPVRFFSTAFVMPCAVSAAGSCALVTKLFPGSFEAITANVSIPQVVGTAFLTIVGAVGTAIMAGDAYERAQSMRNDFSNAALRLAISGMSAGSTFGWALMAYKSGSLLPLLAAVPYFLPTAMLGHKGFDEMRESFRRISRYNAFRHG